MTSTHSSLQLTPDELLTTTRAVRKRLDFSRPVEPEVLRECLEIALQAPSGTNAQGWHFIVITDLEKKKGIRDLYRPGFLDYRQHMEALNAQISEPLSEAEQQKQKKHSYKKVPPSCNLLMEHSLQDQCSQP